MLEPGPAGRQCRRISDSLGPKQTGRSCRSVPLNWFYKTRLRVFAVLVAACLAVFGVLTWAALPVVPVVGVAILTVAAVVNQMTSRLADPVCYQCGGDLDTSSTGCYGVICSGCGAVNEAVPGGSAQSRLTMRDAETDTTSA